MHQVPPAVVQTPQWLLLDLRHLSEAPRSWDGKGKRSPSSIQKDRTLESLKFLKGGAHTHAHTQPASRHVKSVKLAANNAKLYEQPPRCSAPASLQPIACQVFFSGLFSRRTCRMNPGDLENVPPGQQHVSDTNDRRTCDRWRWLTDDAQLNIL